MNTVISKLAMVLLSLGARTLPADFHKYFVGRSRYISHWPCHAKVKEIARKKIKNPRAVDW